MDRLMRGWALQEETIRLLAQLSGLSGYLSISFWLFAQIPQVIKNHTDKSVDGFSLGFLLCWFAGDFLNLVSCLLNEAMAFQVLLSGYYCAIDLVLACQYYYYKRMYHNPASRWYHPPRRRGRHMHSPRTSLRNNLETYGSIDTEMMMDEHPASASKPPQRQKLTRKELLASPNYKTTPRTHVKGVFKKQKAGISKLVTSALLTGFTKVQGLPIRAMAADGGGSGGENNSVIYRLLRFLLSMDSYTLGRILAWACTALYLVSRVPQLWTNHRLRSTKGLSLKLICFALCGNFFYSASLLLSESSTAGGDVAREFWRAELSYLVGACGTVMFDFFVLVQWYVYDVRGGGGYRRTKSGRLRVVSPEVGAEGGHQGHIHSLEGGGSTAARSMMISIAHKPAASLSDPVSVSASVKSTLSPSHMKKISEFTPLSPMDFLLDDYMAGRPCSLSKTKKSSRSSIHTVLAKKGKMAEEELDMSMDEDEN